jgi:hypothetical protein
LGWFEHTVSMIHADSELFFEQLAIRAPFESVRYTVSPSKCKRESHAMMDAIMRTVIQNFSSAKGAILVCPEEMWFWKARDNSVFLPRTTAYCHLRISFHYVIVRKFKDMVLLIVTKGEASHVDSIA